MLRFITALVIASLLFSCNNNSRQQLQVNKIAAEGLLQSIQSITDNNNIIYKALQERLSEPYSAVQARLWQPKAFLIKEKSDSLFIYFEWLIVELKKSAGLKLMDLKEEYDESNIDAVAKTLTGANSPEKIIKKLYQYKNDVLAVDPELNETFGKNIVIISRQYQTIYNKENAAADLFKDIPVLAAIVLLRRFQNNIKNIEENFIRFCFYKIPSGSCGFQIIQPLISQSSSIVSKGEKIKIVAGIGAYSVTINPKIIIDGKKFETSETDGIAESEFIAPDKKGKYSKTVSIEFTGIDGKRHTSSRIITYTVKE
jgi:hypothetical protein